MEEISLASQTVFHLFGLPVHNTVIATWLGMAFLIIIAAMVRLNLKSLPRGLQNIVEWIVEALLDLVTSVTQDRSKALKFFPWISTFFLFILTLNWLELIPGFSLIGLEENHHFTPIFRSANTDLNTTMALAIISVFVTQVFGIAAIGFSRYAAKFINFHSPIDFFVGILEAISEMAKLISFSFRLFGNIFAGEVLLVVISFLIPYIAPIPFYGLELFVGFIQALVFSMLTLVFMTMATVGHEEH